MNQAVIENQGMPEPAKQPSNMQVRLESVNKNYHLWFSKVLIRNSLATIITANSHSAGDTTQYAVQHFRGVPDSSMDTFYKQWQNVQTAKSIVPNGIIDYLECYLEKEDEGNIATLVMKDIGQPLRDAIAGEKLNMLDILAMLLQVSEVLYSLKQKNTYFPQNLNPDTITMAQPASNLGKQFKIAYWTGWPHIYLKEYKKIDEYVNYVAPEIALSGFEEEEGPLAGVYALGIIALEAIGFSKDQISRFRLKHLEPGYMSDDSVEKELIRILMSMIEPDKFKRTGPEELNSQIQSLMARKSELGLPLAYFRNRIEWAPLEEVQITEIKHTRGLIALDVHHVMVNTNPAVETNPAFETNRALETNRNELIESQPLENIKNKKEEALFKARSKWWQRGALGLIIFISLIIVGFDLAILIIRYTHNANISQLQGAINGIYLNLNATPFSDITFAYTCPSGYQAMEMGVWPGTDGFCYALDIIVVLSTEDEYTLGCQNFYYPPISAQEYTEWKNMKLCAQQVSGFSTLYPCPAGYTQCYSGVCIQGSACGITSLVITTAAMTGVGWYSNLMSDGNYLNYRKDSGSLPITEFTITLDGSVPCLSVSEFPTQPNYGAIAIESDGCSNYGFQPGAQILDNDSATDIFDFQQWSYNPQTNLPSFASTTSGIEGYLTYSPRLELSTQGNCLETDFSVFLNNYPELSAPIRADENCSIAIISLLGAAWIIILAINYIKRSEAPPLFTNLMVFAVFYFTIMILAIVASALSAKDISNIIANIDSMKYVSDNQCFVSATAQNVVDDYVSIAYANYTITVLWRPFTIIICILALPFGIIAYYVRKYQQS